MSPFLLRSDRMSLPLDCSPAKRLPSVSHPIFPFRLSSPQWIRNSVYNLEPPLQFPCLFLRFSFSFLLSVRFPPSQSVIFQDFWALLINRGRTATQAVSEPTLQKSSQSMSNTDCSRNEFDSCRDQSGLLTLKIIAMSLILMAGMIGVAVPLLGKRCRGLRTDSNLFVAAKAFAAGVILATGFVHMLPDGTSALSDPCLPDFPWSKFPFSGFIAMLASLATLVVDFVGTQYYEKKNELIASRVDADESASLPDGATSENMNGKVFGEEEGGGMHIVGIHAHAAHHRHSHPHGREACDGLLTRHSHSHEEGGVRHVVVSQILELGIVSHSLIIGLSLGVSKSACTVRPLIAALSFHQFFEGFALGGCISQAQFRTLSAAIMACFFAITTPAGILVGIAVSSSYNSNSARALVVEGIFDSVSAGILVYMALVDLIAADFLSKKMSCNTRLQVVSYFALFLGAMLMSSLAAWV